MTVSGPVTAKRLPFGQGVADTYAPLQLPQLYEDGGLTSEVHRAVTSLPAGTDADADDVAGLKLVHVCGCCEPPDGVYAKHAM